MNRERSKTRREALQFGSLAAAGALLGNAVTNVSYAQSSKVEGIIVDGKTINLKAVQEKGPQLNQVLQNPANFKALTEDPSGFARQHGLDLDPALAQQLKQKLQGVPSLDAAQSRVRDNGGGATIAAVAKGALAVSDSKIAVAF